MRNAKLHMYFERVEGKEMHCRLRIPRMPDNDRAAQRYRIAQSVTPAKSQAALTLGAAGSRGQLSYANASRHDYPGGESRSAPRTVGLRR